MNLALLSKFAFTKGNRNYFRIYLLGLSFSLVLYIFLNTSFIPFFLDEIDYFIKFVTDVKINSFEDFIKGYKGSFHSVHNMFLGKLLYYEQYELFGTLDFRLLPVLGAIFYCMTLYIVIMSCYSLCRPRFLIFPSLLLFLPINLFHNWGLVAPGFLIFFLLVVGTNAIGKNSVKSDLIFLFAVLICVLTGTGSLALPAFGLVLLIYYKRVSIQKMIILGLGFLLAVYIYGMRTVAAAPPADRERELIEFVKYVGASSGSIFQYIIPHPYRYLCILIGLVILMGLMFLVYLNRAKLLARPLLVALLGYVLIVPLAGSIQRSHYGFHYAFNEYFQIYSLFLFFLTTVLFHSSFEQSKFRILLWPFQGMVILLILGNTNFNLRAFDHERKHLEVGYVNYLADPNVKQIFWDNLHGERWRTLLSKAIDGGMFDASKLRSKVKPYHVDDMTFKRLVVPGQGSLLAADLHHLYIFARPLMQRRDVKYSIILESQKSIKAYCAKLANYDGKIYGVLDLADLPADLANYKMYLLGSIEDGIDYRDEFRYSFLGPQLIRY